MSKRFSQKLFDLQNEIGKISKDSTNPFFKSKYFDINKLLEHLQPLFEKHGVVCLQPIVDGCVTTRLIDSEPNEIDEEKGTDFVESSMALPPITDPQKMGSAVTYYRRYTLTSLLSIQAEDDDGNKASGNVKKNTSNPLKSEVPPKTPEETPKAPTKYIEPDTKDWQNALEKKKTLVFVKKFYLITPENEKKYEAAYKSLTKNQ